MVKLAQNWKRLVAATLAALMSFSAVAYAQGAGEAQVRRDLETFLRTRVEDSSATIEIPRLSVFVVSGKRWTGSLRTEIHSKAVVPFQGRVPVTVALYSGNELVKRAVISPHIRSVSKVVVPSRNLRRGDVLSSDDLMVVERDVERMPRDAVVRIEEAVGLRLKRSVRRDAFLRTSQMEGVPVVERGDRVMLVLESGPLVVQAIGRTQESGAIGEWIRVMNLDSKRELLGRLDRQGRVHVAF